MIRLYLRSIRVKLLRFRRPLPKYLKSALSRSGKTVLSVVGSGAAVVQYLSSLADLQERTGELRRGASDGAYVLGRYEKGRFASYSSVGSRLRYSTVSFGTDKKSIRIGLSAPNLA